MIADIFGRTVVWGLLIAFCVYIVGTWLRWSRAQVKLSPPRWRSGISIIGFGASTASLTLIVALGVHAFITGGLPYYSVPLTLAFRVGFLTALCGVVAALIGKGPLEVPTSVSSLLCQSLERCGSIEEGPFPLLLRRACSESIGPSSAIRASPFLLPG